MRISKHLHQHIRIKNSLLTLLILILLCTLAWLSQRYQSSTDLSFDSHNTLSKTSQSVLEKLSGEVSITAYIKQRTLQQQIAQLIAKYQRIKSDIHIKFVNPDQTPEKVRELNIGPQGAFIIEYQQRTKKLDFLDESSLSNALRQLSHSRERLILFLTGHGERRIDSMSNSDFGIFANELKQYKFQLDKINLAQQAEIPVDTAVLVIADPKTQLLPTEHDMLRDYIIQGGNLLLLSEPNKNFLMAIEQQLGVQKLVGTVVDNSASLYGLDQPSFLLLSSYPLHPISSGFNSMSLFPVSAAFTSESETEYETQALLNSSKTAWNETDASNTPIQFDVDSAEQQGVLSIGYSLTRSLRDNQQQRILLVGDADFLSNAYLGQVGNSELGFRMLNWLSDNDLFINIPIKTSPGKSLQLSKTSIMLIAFGFLFALPCLFIASGFIIWRKRKQR